MEVWFLILVSLSLLALLNFLINHFFILKKPTQTLPPGPPTLPIIGNFLWLRKSFFDLERILRPLHAKLGPVVTLPIGYSPAIFVADRALAHQSLVRDGVVYADRPPALAITKITSSNQHVINSAPYGPTWRVLRRNLTAEILQPSRVKSFSRARERTVGILVNRIESQAKSGKPVLVVDDLRYAMFCLLVFMCFGDEIEESHVEKIGEAQRTMLVNIAKFDILNFWPRVTKVVFRKLWKEFLENRKRQENVLIPLISARKNIHKEMMQKTTEDHIKEHVNHGIPLCYVDTLLSLELPDEKRKLNGNEMVSLCSEFLNAGTDTTTTALQWILANLVKYPEIQHRIFKETKGIVGNKENKEEVNEDDLQKMPYLKAVILEGLRRHPPGHLLLPHAVTKDTVLDKYLVPKNGVINFMVAEMGWDPEVWEDPMAFKPERFIGKEDFDITGSREIKMMPFGAGRRICPGLALAMLHLEYFVANLVWKFEWRAIEGDDIDLSEKEEFTVVMKYPLKAHVFPRSK